MVKKFVLNLLGNIFASLGAALMVQTMIGNGTFGAMTYNLSLLTNIKVGDWTIIANSIMVVLQFVILRKEFAYYQFLQLLPVIISGKMVNFFLYDLSLTANLSFTHYILALLVFVLALAMNAFGISLVLKSDLVPFPSEGLSQTIASKTKTSFKVIRTLCDAFFVLVALVCMIPLGNTNAIREGTIINVLFMGIFIAGFNKLLKVEK